MSKVKEKENRLARREFTEQRFLSASERQALWFLRDSRPTTDLTQHMDIYTDCAFVRTLTTCKGIMQENGLFDLATEMYIKTNDCATKDKIIRDDCTEK